MKKDTASTRTTSAATCSGAPASGSRYAFWQLSLTIVVVFLLIDIGSKMWAEQALKPEWWGSSVTRAVYESRPVVTVIPGCFRLVYAENRGAAFSILDGHVMLLGLVSVAATVGLFLYWCSLPPGLLWARAAVALIVSGAIGNMIDRLFRGYVVDFFDAYISQYQWPTFNVADSCICVGAGVMILLFLKRKL